MNEIEAVLQDPCVSYWLKEAIRVMLQRDVVDAARDAEVLYQLMDKRAKLMLGR